MTDFLTCLIKDDISGFLLLYRKLLSTSFDLIGINTAYDRKNQKFVLNEDLFSSFPRTAYLGPTPVYETYITMSNFPHFIDLENYKDNIINIDMMEHVKTKHLDKIFPKQRTQHHHKINVKQAEFESAVKHVNKEELNISLNIFDSHYDKDMTLEYDVTYCLSKLQQEIDLPITIYIVGLIHEEHSIKIEKQIKNTLAPFDFQIHNFSDKTLSEQMGILLHSDMLISGPYGLGLLAYTARVPAFIVYPFIMYEMKGKTTDPTRKNIKYIETTDDEIFQDLPQVIELIKKNRI